MSARPSSEAGLLRATGIPEFSARIALVAIGGGVGAALRGLCGILFRDLLQWPAWTGTLTVNLAGAFLIGVAFARLDPGPLRIEDARLLAGDLPQLERRRRLLASLFVTGGLGALTTFSAFGIESAELLVHGRLVEAASSVIGSLVLGLGAVSLGLRAGRPAVRPGA